MSQTPTQLGGWDEARWRLIGSPPSSPGPSRVDPVRPADPVVHYRCDVCWATYASSTGSLSDVDLARAAEEHIAARHPMLEAEWRRKVRSAKPEVADAVFGATEPSVAAVDVVDPAGGSGSREQARASGRHRRKGLYLSALVAAMVIRRRGRGRREG